MASSYSFYKKELKEYLKKYDPEIEILDVGAGCGTYALLLGDYFNNIDCVEVYKPNIERYELNKRYRKAYNEDIRNFKYEWYDVVIFGDILEHLEIEEAQEVLEYAMKHSKQVIAAVPYEYKQGIVEGNEYEIHKQDDLTPKIMKERYPMLKELFRNELYGYYERNEIEHNNTLL